MKDIRSIESLIKPETYQVFLFICTAALPFVFAKHPWFVVNKKGTVSRWEVFWKTDGLKTSWGHLHKDHYALFQGVEMFVFSDKYHWNNTELVGVVEGDEDSLAKRMAEFIENSPQTYPYCSRYVLGGPNSNSYAQWVLNKFPESNMRLPWNSFGKSAAPKLV